MPRIANTEVLDRIVLTIAEATEPQTKRTLDTSDYFINKLIAAGTVEKVLNAVKVTDAEGNPTKGHPANAFKLTKRGRDKARRLRQKAQRAQAA